MESGDSGVTSPVLRVTAEISELKANQLSRGSGKISAPPSGASKDGRPPLFSRRKLNPLYGPNPYQRSNYAGSFVSAHQLPKNNVSAFTQRVMSAKLLRTKQLQNQLAETQMKLNEVLHENRTLKTLQKRQDSVLKKYEGNQEQLPQLLKSHHEEIRVLTEKHKQLRTSYRELETRMKQKDNELTNLREQYKHLLKLSRDKNLGEREKLAQRVEELEAIVEQQKTKLQSLDKRLQIEEKNHRHQLSLEVNKFRKMQAELNSALETISNLKATLEAKDRFASASYPRFQKSAPAQAKPSHVSLQAPPRVSIRQTQRLAHSDTALQQDDSETAESFTVDYSPGEPGNSSMDSDNSSNGSKEGNKNDVLPPQKESRLVGMIPGSIRISKAAFKERRLRRSITEIKPIKPVEHKFEKTDTIQRRRSMDRTTIKDNTNKETNANGKNDTITNGSKETNKNGTKEKRKSVDIEHRKEISEVKAEESTNFIPQTNNIVHSSDNVSHEKTLSETDPKYKHLETQEDRLFNEIEREINSQELLSVNDMKLNMDAEFEKFLEGTKLSDEAINEYFKRDFRAEIQEIEKKFQDLDKASERYIKMEKNVNGTSFHIPLENDSEDDQLPSSGKDERRNEMLENTKQNGLLLEGNQKANLLKALSDIDESSKAPSREREEPKEHTTDLPTAKVRQNSTIPVSNVARTRRKSLIMKDLFGAEGTKL